jgi:hypothetical protein
MLLKDGIPLLISIVPGNGIITTFKAEQNLCKSKFCVIND